MNHRNNFILLLLAAVVLTACVKTEIIPEELEPKLRVEPATVSLLVGQTRPLAATYTDAEGTDQSDLIQWRTTDPSIISVSPDGLLSAQTPGQAWAIASVPAGLSDSTLVTVVESNNAVAKVIIAASQTVLVTGTTLQLSATAFNGNNQEISGQTLTWASSNSAILSVNADGLVTGLSAGTASVTATAAGVNSLPLTIQVTPIGGLSRTGTFSGNMGYSVSGTATLQQIGTSLKLILGSNFQASNGPMLGVYLAKTASGGLNAQNSLKLANLAQNSGAQEYDVSAGVALTDYNFVVIYCIPFNVRFGTAQLSN